MKRVHILRDISKFNRVHFWRSKQKTGAGRYKMKKAGFLAIVLFLSLTSAACYQPIRSSTKDESFLRQHAGKQPWHKVVVLPFTGDPAFCRANAEWFTHLVEKHNLFEVIGPAVAEIELGKQGVRFGDADISIGTAQEAGRVLGADGVIVGSLKTSITERSDVFWGKKVASVSIVDVVTGKVVAASGRSDVLTGTNAAAVALSATGDAADDLLPVLYALAGRTWTSLPKKQDLKP
jgi:hypothetical protein